MQLRYLIFCFILANTIVNANPSGKEMIGYQLDDVIITGSTNISNFQLSYNEEQFSDIRNSPVRSANSLQIYIPAKKIEAESKTMLDDFLELIHADEHPMINISMERKQVSELNRGDLLNHRIYLTMKGVTKDYDCRSEVKDCQQGKFCLNGKLNVLFTDFGIDPPRKFFGLVKVKNEVFISFKVFFLTENKETNN